MTRRVCPWMRAIGGIQAGGRRTEIISRGSSFEWWPKRNQTHHANNHHHREEDLEGDRESPRDAPSGKVEAQVEPIADHDTEGDQRPLEQDELTTAVRLGAFGLVRRNGRGKKTVSDTGDDPRDEHHCVVHRRCLEDCSDDHDTATAACVSARLLFQLSGFAYRVMVCRRPSLSPT